MITFKSWCRCGSQWVLPVVLLLGLVQKKGKTPNPTITTDSPFYHDMLERSTSLQARHCARKCTLVHNSSTVVQGRTGELTAGLGDLALGSGSSADAWPAKWWRSWSPRHGDGPCSTSEVPSSMPSSAAQRTAHHTHTEVSGSGLCKALSAQCTKRIWGCQHGWPPWFLEM